MPRVAKKIICNESDILELRSIVENPLSDPHLVVRAKAILLCVEGADNKSVAAKLEVRNNIVGDWRNAYVEGGIEGLKGQKRPGRRGNGNPDRRELVKELVKQPPKDGKWTAESLSIAAETSVDTVRRALREEGVTLERKTRWEIPAENQPRTVSIGIAGLYLSDGDKAIIIATSNNGELDFENGRISTSDSAHATDLEKLLSENGYVPIADALECLLREADSPSGNVRRRVEMQEYLAGIAMSMEERKDVKLHAVVLNVSGASPALSHPNLAVTIAPDFESWVTLAGLWIDPLCGSDSMRISRILSMYTNKNMSSREPVIWKADAANPKEEETSQQMEPFSDPSVDNVLRISATITGRDGNEIHREAEFPNGVPDLGEICYDSALSLGASVGKLERSISAGMTDVARELCEGYMDVALKKTAIPKKE